MAGVTTVTDRRPAPVGAVGTRLVDRLDRRVVNVLTVLGFGVPVVAYLWVVSRFSVNVLYLDQVTDVTVIGASRAHTLTLGDLWAQHQVHRLFFPHLLDIVLADTVHFNTRFQEFVSAVVLLASVTLVIWAHRRRSPGTPWLYYCPVAILMLSLVQYENTLWGFQLAWYMILLALSVAIVAMDRVTLTTWALVGAIAAGVVGSYSSLQGLLIWPAGLVLLYHRKRGWPAFAAWIGCGVATTVLYFHNFNGGGSGTDNGYAIHHPWATVKFFVFAVGDILGIAVKGWATNGNVIPFGIVILVLAVLVMVGYGVRRDDRTGGPIGVTLVVFGLLFALIITPGRVAFGLLGASQSRYTTFDLLILVGIYLTVLGRPTLRSARATAAVESDPAGAPSELETVPAPAGPDRSLRVLRWVVASVIVVQVLVGLTTYPGRIESDHNAQLNAARVSLDVDHSTDAQLVFFIGQWGKGPYIRQQLLAARQMHINLYYGTPAGGPAAPTSG